jgi:hypothetical protein
MKVNLQRDGSVVACNRIRKWRLGTELVADGAALFVTRKGTLGLSRNIYLRRRETSGRSGFRLELKGLDRHGG